MQILPWAKMGHFCTTSFAKEKNLRHQNITHIIPISHRVAINHLISFFPAIFSIRCLSDVCQMSDVRFCHVSLTLFCISSVIKYQKWIHLFLPQPNGFCQVRLLSINCANMQNCFCNVDSTDLPKPSSANLPHLLSIYAEMVPPVYLSKMEKMFFFVAESINFVWVKMHYNLFFWPVSHNLNDNIQSTNRTAQWA